MPQTKADPRDWQPTPTQEENDLAAQGQHVMDKEPDGSPITDFGGDPQKAEHKKEVHAEPSRGGYQTRQAKPAPAPAPAAAAPKSE